MIHKLHYITTAITEVNILSEVKSVMESGVTWIQLSAKEVTGNFEVTATKVKEITDSYDAVLILENNLSIVNSINANGVYITDDSISVEGAIKVLDENKIIGVSANSFVEAKNLELQGANYVSLNADLGYDMISKIIPISEPYGWQMASFKIPLLVQNVSELKELKVLKSHSGIHGLSCSSLIRDSDNKKDVVHQLNAIIN